MKKALTGRVLITIAGLIGLVDFVMIFNVLPLGEWLDGLGFLSHPVSGLVLMLILSSVGVILLHRAKKTAKRTRLDVFALVSGWVLIAICCLFLGIMASWVALFNF